jgi:hypothetical protein
MFHQRIGLLVFFSSAILWSACDKCSKYQEDTFKRDDLKEEYLDWVNVNAPTVFIEQVRLNQFGDTTQLDTLKCHYKVYNIDQQYQPAPNECEVYNTCPRSIVYLYVAGNEINVATYPPNPGSYITALSIDNCYNPQGFDAKVDGNFFFNESSAVDTASVDGKIYQKVIKKDIYDNGNGIHYFAQKEGFIYIKKGFTIYKRVN